MENISIKTTGITRPVDSLGRVVLPIELRRSFDIQEGDRLEIFVSEEKIVLGKAVPRCAVCASTDGDMYRIGDCRICRSCATRIAEKIGRAGRNVCVAAP